MCGTINPGPYIRCVLGFGIKTGYDTRLVDKANTWLFYTFTRYVGA
jgi:hypothetical protein